jgi:integrase
LSDDVSTAARDAWISGKRRDGRTGTISPTTARYVLRTPRTVLRYAVGKKWLDDNPAAYVSPPKASRHEAQPLGGTEVRRLLDAARSTDPYRPILIAVYSGVRRGELLGLKWGALGLERRSIAVRRALEVDRTANNSIREKSTKTGRARAIPLPLSVAEELRTCKSAQAQRLLAKGLRQDRGTFVLDRVDGQPWHPDSFGRRWTDFVKTSGVRRARFHGLRATFASLPFEANNDPVKVQHLPGHASLKLAMEVYAKVTTGAELTSADRLEALVRAAA